MTWRDALRLYNEDKENLAKLQRAGDLYAPREHVFRNLYRDLVVAFGRESVFILSAGWGLVRSDFWIPDYNITFSRQSLKKKPWAWRNASVTAHRWQDFNHMQDAQIAQDEPIHFFGGNDYLPLFYALMETVPGKKVVHHKSDIERRSSFSYQKYTGPEKHRTWHYRAAKEFAAEHHEPENRN